MNTQAQRITKQQLYQKGYTISAAARILGCAPAHLNQVVNGGRCSRRLIALLLDLPPRDLVLRERLTPVH